MVSINCETVHDPGWKTALTLLFTREFTNEVTTEQTVWLLGNKIALHYCNSKLILKQKIK